MPYNDLIQGTEVCCCFLNAYLISEKNVFLNDITLTCPWILKANVVGIASSFFCIMTTSSE